MLILFLDTFNFDFHIILSRFSDFAKIKHNSSDKCNFWLGWHNYVNETSYESSGHILIP